MTRCCPHLDGNAVILKYLSATEEGNNTCTKSKYLFIYCTIVLGLVFSFNLGANFDNFIPTVLFFFQLVSFFFNCNFYLLYSDSFH